MPIPTEADQERARWALLQAQIDQTRRQAFWEPWKAFAMILLAAAAIAAAGGIAGRLWPTPPTEITVHFDQPVAVRPVP